MSPEQAANLLRDDYFKAELDKLRQQEIDTIVNSRLDDIDKRENAYRMIKCIDGIVTHFQSIVDSAELKRKRRKFF
jgi:hypothetical protein